MRPFVDPNYPGHPSITMLKVFLKAHYPHPVSQHVAFVISNAICV